MDQLCSSDQTSGGWKVGIRRGKKEGMGVSRDTGQCGFSGGPNREEWQKAGAKELAESRVLRACDNGGMDSGIGGPGREGRREGADLTIPERLTDFPGPAIGGARNRKSHKIEIRKEGARKWGGTSPECRGA